MKAIILAAGYGSRLLPVTRDVPKCLVRVGGTEILLLQLRALAAAGIGEAVVVTGYRRAQVDAFVAEAMPLAVTTRFNPFWSVANSIGSVWVARDALADDFCLLNGDTVFGPGVLATALTDAREGVGLLVEPVAGATPDDMLVAAPHGRVEAVAKDMDAARATHRSLGVIVGRGPNGYGEALDQVIGAPEGQSSYHHAVIDRMAQDGVPVAAIGRAAGMWQEIDRPEDIRAWASANDAAHAGGGAA